MSFQNQSLPAKIWKEYTKRFERELIRWGVLTESNNVTPFVLYTFQRFGSNMLTSMLNHHPHVRCFGELFSSPTQILFNTPGFRHLDKKEYLLHLRKNYPVQFVSHFTLSNHPKYIKACGFKLFYNQPKKNRTAFLDKLLQKEFKILHLKRRNLLAAYTSKQIALNTGIWVGRDKNSSTRENQIKIDIDAFETYLYQMNYQNEEINELVKPGQLFELYYEDLLQSKKQSNLLTFLNLPEHQLVSKTIKQRNKPLRKLIINYDELKQYFNGREEEQFFD